MIDFHNHILPNVDDGPKTIKESLDMLRNAHAQGISEVVNTVHFQHPKMYDKNVDIDFLKYKVNQLNQKLKDENINIKIHLAAEVFYLPNLSEISSNPLLTIGNGKYMLVEFTNNIYPNDYEKIFFDLQMKDISPIIAHPERYRFIQNNVDILKDWIKKGFIIQIDAGSLLGYFDKKTKKIVELIVEKSYFHLIGSDAHNNKKRNFCLEPAYNLLKKKYGVRIIDTLKKNAELLLIGEKLEELNIKQSDSMLSKIKSKFLNKLK